MSLFLCRGTWGVTLSLQGDLGSYDIFRYMLVHFGYLTTKNQAISIPNEEVKSLYKNHFENWVAVHKPDEFLKFITPLVHSKKDFNYLETVLKKLQLEKSLEEALLNSLDALQTHQKATEIFDAIARRDTSTLQKVLSEEEKVRCESALFNFNFLHLAALVGDKEIFSKIEEYCGTSLLSSKDKQGLTPVDYAYLSSNQSAVFFSLKERKKEANLIYSPGFGSKFFCYAAIPTIGGIIPQLLATIVRIYSGVPAPTAVKALVKAPNLLVMALGMSAGTYFKDSVLSYLDFDVCKNYKNYNDINAKSPRQFNSLKQLEKYRADHKNI